MTTEHRSADTSAIPQTEDRDDDFLRHYRPARVTPHPDKWPIESRWTDYDFRSEAEFRRWSQLRAEEFRLAQPNRVLIPHPNR